MITINDNLIYLPYKEDSFSDINYFKNQAVKDAIEMMKENVELIANGKDAIINVIGDLNSGNDNDSMRFEVFCEDEELYKLISESI